MPDTVVVTINWNKESADFELPVKAPFEKWVDALKEAVKHSFYGIRVEDKEISLLFHGKAIPKDATLAECSIFDGEILVLQVK